MADTRLSLIYRLQSGESRQKDWSDFVTIYGPGIHRYCLGRGLQRADAEDVTGEVLVNVFRFIGTYDRANGSSFASWLGKVIANKVTDEFRKRRRQPVGSGRTTINEQLQNVPAPSGDDHLPITEDGMDPRVILDEVLPNWLAEAQDLAESAYGRELVRSVKDRFESKTWQAFLLSTFQGLTAKETASLIGLSPDAVYKADERVRKTLEAALNQTNEGGRREKGGRK